MTVQEALNTLIANQPDAVQLLKDEHRSNQQAFGRLVVKFIEMMAEQKHDARNQDTVEFAQAVLANVPAHTLILPRI